MLDEVGLIHMNGRVYEPALGRFMSADPMVTYPNRVTSFNRYAYALDNPLRFVDPTGWDVESVDPIGNNVGESSASTSQDDRNTGSGIGISGLVRLVGDGVKMAGEGLFFMVEQGVRQQLMEFTKNNPGDFFPVDRLARYVEKKVDPPDLSTPSARSAAETGNLYSILLPGGMIAKAKKASAAKSTVQILEREGNVIVAAFNGANGEARVVTEVVRAGDRLILNGTHIEGAGTLKEALNAAKVFGREQGAKEVVIQGGIRTTGANPGHLPRPITIKVDQ